MIVDGCSGCMTICEEEGRHSIPWCGVRDMCFSRSHDVRGDRQERKESDQTLPMPTTPPSMLFNLVLVLSYCVTALCRR